MKVERKDLGETPVDLDVNCSPESLDLVDPDYRFEEPVRGRVNFKLMGDRVLARGNLSTHIIGQCKRCLADVRLPLQAVVDAVYENDAELLKPERKAFGSDEQIVTYYDGESIHPEPELREHLMLELPPFPLCAEDCPGLCVNCGANLNEGICSCGDKTRDTSEWKSALKSLKLQ